MLFSKALFLTFLIFSPTTSYGAPTDSLKAVDKIVVEKSKRSLSLYAKDKLLQSYRVALGFAPEGHKFQEGDGKTPEGTYMISGKNPNSTYHKSLKISYPNNQDIQTAAATKVSPGRNIMIHGLPKSYAYLGFFHTLYDWTLGCIALTNAEIEKIYKAVDIGTIVEILP